MFTQGIPAAAFEVDDLDREWSRLKGLGVAFVKDPTRTGPVSIAVCSDTCGNLVQIYQPAAARRG
jgi:glyoxylase I family protein